MFGGFLRLKKNLVSQKRNADNILLGNIFYQSAEDAVFKALGVE